LGIRKNYEKTLHEKLLYEAEVDESPIIPEVTKHLNQFYLNDADEREKILNSIMRKNKRIEKNIAKKTKQKAENEKQKFQQ